MSRHVLLLCVALSLTAAPAGAVILWDQPLNPGIEGSDSELEGGHIADNFMLTARSTLETISWAGHYVGPTTVANPVAFRIRFFADDGGAPGLPVTSYFVEYDVEAVATPTGDVHSGYYGDAPYFSYSYSLPSVTLDPATYWVSILESDPRTAASNTSQWHWARSAQGAATSAYRTNDLNPTWSPGGGDFAFTLTSAESVIPEPTTLALLCLGLGLMRALRRRG